MNTMDFNKLLKKIFWQECYLMETSNTDLFYRVKFLSTLNSEEFMKFADNCEKFLSQYGIKTGAIVTLYPEEFNKIYLLQINKTPTNGKFSEKWAVLLKDNQLHEALNQGAVAQLKRLLDKGANVNNQNIAGETLLHIAVRRGYEAIVSLLLGEGALINIPNNKGETALQIVDQKKDVTIGIALIGALLNKDPKAAKPNFEMQELSDYWNVQSLKQKNNSTQRPMPTIPGARTVRNLIQFFSRERETTQNDENLLKNQVVSTNLGK